MTTQTDIENISEKIARLGDMEEGSRNLLELSTAISLRMERLQNVATAAIKILKNIQPVNQAVNNLQKIVTELDTATAKQKRTMNGNLSSIRDAFPNDGQVNEIIKNLKSVSTINTEATKRARVSDPFTEGENKVLQGGYDWRSGKSKKTRSKGKGKSKSKRTTRTRGRGRSKGGKRK